MVKPWKICGHNAQKEFLTAFTLYTTTQQGIDLLC